MTDDIAKRLEKAEALAELSEQYRRERDQLREQVATLNANIDTFLGELKQAKKERDEARAEADRWKRSCNVFRERDWPKAFQATVTSLEQEVSDAHEQLAKLRKLSKPWEGDAYRRGAEAMRKAAVAWLENNYASIDAEYISALPIPEEP